MDANTVVHIIDSEGELAAALQSLLHNYDISVSAHQSTRLFLANTDAKADSRSCLLLALSADCTDGLEQVRELHERRPGLPVVVLCDTPDDELRNQYITLGATDLVSKSMVDAYVFTRLSAVCPDTSNLPVIPPSTLSAPDGRSITIRMITPEDAEIEQAFVRKLSDRSRYLRFFSGLRELPKHMLRQLTTPDFPVSYALIATAPDAEGEQQIGVARYAPTQDSQVAEFAVVVADEWQGLGIASQLLRYLIAAATVAGLHRLEGLILFENKPMLRLAKKLGFVVTKDGDLEPSIVKVVKELR